MQPINLVFRTVFVLLHMQISLPREWLDWFEQGNEYEPAPGKVYRHSYYHNGVCWSHGNFVARKKRSGWLSFLPAPRTLFFFELAHGKDFDGVVTCTPLGMLYFLDASSLLFLLYIYNTPISVCTRWKIGRSLQLWSDLFALFYLLYIFRLWKIPALIIHKRMTTA